MLTFSLQFFLECLICGPLLYGIQEFIRLPRFIYINTSLAIIIFIICAILLYVVEYGQHDWFYLVKLPLVPGTFIIFLMARVDTISKDESEGKPYLNSAHLWLKWIANKLFGWKYADKGFAWFVYISLFANIASAAIDEMNLNSLYAYNSINGVILCCTMPIPFCYDTDIAHAKVDSSSIHDLSWDVNIGWITLYTLWNISYIAFKYSETLTFHAIILTVAYLRALIYHRNDLWLHARAVTLSVAALWMIPNSFLFSRRLFHRAPFQLDVNEINNLRKALEWITFCCMIYAVLYFVYWSYITCAVVKRYCNKRHQLLVVAASTGDDSTQVEVEDEPLI